MKISLKETINWLRKRYEYSKNGPWAIEFDENEAKISRMGKLDSSIKWEEVERIRAFKNDRFAYDPIVIVLETQDESISVPFEELWSGYNDFLEEVLLRWPHIGKEWINEINKGAFVPNPTLLWERTTVEKL